MLTITEKEFIKVGTVSVLTLRSLISKVPSLLYQVKVVSSLLFEMKIAFMVNSTCIYDI